MKLCLALAVNEVQQNQSERKWYNQNIGLATKRKHKTIHEKKKTLLKYKRHTIYPPKHLGERC